VLAECRERAAGHPDIHVVELAPTANIEINALQRASSVILQKSLREGFGLTVSEALWKGKPVIAGAVGGIPLQITHRYSGILTHTIDGTAYWIKQLLNAPTSRSAWERTAASTCAQNFLLTRHLRDYMLLFLYLSHLGESLIRSMRGENGVGEGNGRGGLPLAFDSAAARGAGEFVRSVRGLHRRRKREIRAGPRADSPHAAYEGRERSVRTPQRRAPRPNRSERGVPAPRSPSPTPFSPSVERDQAFAEVAQVEEEEHVVAEVARQEEVLAHVLAAVLSQALREVGGVQELLDPVCGCRRSCGQDARVAGA